VHHDIRLSRHSLVIHGPNSVPNVTFNGELRPVLLGAVRNGDRHDPTPYQGPGDQNPQGGVIYSWTEDGVTCTDNTASITNEMNVIDNTVGYRCRLPLESFSLSSISLWQFLGIDDREQGFADGSGPTANNAHLRQRVCRYQRPK